MTPQERQLVDDLFDRLARLESTPRDPDAAASIARGLRAAPNAVYALVQTVLVQDEALKRAHDRIQQLEGGDGQAENRGGFLDTMRDAIFGQSQNATRGSVPNVRAPDLGNRPVWNRGQVMGQPASAYNAPQAPYGQPQYSPYAAQSPVGGGGSFLGTAAAAAAGMVGGSLLLGSIRSMMGGGHQAFGDPSAFGGESGRGSWGDQSGTTLAHDAGVDDIGSGHRGDTGADDSRAGFFDQASNQPDQDDFDLDSDGFDGGSDNDVA